MRTSPVGVRLTAIPLPRVAVLAVFQVSSSSILNLVHELLRPRIDFEPAKSLSDLHGDTAIPLREPIRLPGL